MRLWLQYILLLQQRAGRAGRSRSQETGRQLIPVPNPTNYTCTRDRKRKTRQRDSEAAQRQLSSV